MKRIALILTIVIIYSLSVFGQASLIANIGTEVIENNNFNYAKQYFERNGMPLQEISSDKYGYECENPLLIAVIDIAPDEAFKDVLMVNEIYFLCGLTFWYNIENKLIDIGYDFVEEENITLEDGNIIQQKKYEKGTRICLIQTIDEDIKQVSFKINHEYISKII